MASPRWCPQWTARTLESLVGRFTLRDGTAAQPALDAVQRRAGQPRWRERVASAAQAPVRIPGNLVGV